jgi:hypothetical protein
LSLLAAWHAQPQLSLLAQPATERAEAVSSVDLKDALERTQRAFEKLQSAQQQIPRDTFDPSAIVQRVGREPQKLGAWVREQTWWVPYRGALRGPTGVLMDRLGSSLDRALLLAELLRVAGNEVRLARAELTEQQAVTLLPKLPSVPAERRDGATGETTKDHSEVSPDVRAVLERSELRSNKLAEVVVQRVAEQTPPLLRFAKEASAARHDDAQRSAEATPTDCLRDHWWVQHRSGEQWIDLDLLGASVPATETLAPGKLDSKFCHEVELRIVIERCSKGSAPAEQVVLRHTLKASEAFGQHLTVRHYPFDWPRQVDAKLPPKLNEAIKQLTLKQREWLPVISIGQTTVAQTSFNEAGELNQDGAERLANAFDLGGPTGSQVGGIIGSGRIGAASSRDKQKQPEPSSDAALTAEWIEFEIRVPRQSAKIIRRQIFDLLGPDARRAKPSAAPMLSTEQRLERGLALLGESQVLMVACEPSPQAVQYLLVNSLLGKRRALDGLMTDKALDDPGNLLKHAAQFSSIPAQLYGLALARHQWSRHRNAVYLDEPNVFCFHRTLRADVKGNVLICDGFDIVANAVAVLNDGRGGDALAVRLEQGVLDTNAEAVLSAGCGRVENTAQLMATGAGGEWLNVRDARDPAWQQANIPRDARSRIESDLSAGYLVSAPRASVEMQGQPSFAWWRIDPRRGDCLGIGSRGWGQTAVERIITTTFLIWPLVVVTYWAYIGCRGRSAAFGSAKDWACLGCAFLSGVCAELAWLALINIWSAGGIAAAAAGGGAIINTAEGAAALEKIGLVCGGADIVIMNIACNKIDVDW